MAKKDESPQTVIARARKRQQSRPFWVGALAILLVGGGLIALLVWLFGGGKPAVSLNLFATKTPTPTLTLTPTMTLPPSNTPTITPTASETPTLTPSAPFTYRVQEGDSLSSIADQFNLGNDGVPLLLLLNPGLNQCDPLILVGQELTVPNPDMKLPTPTVVSLDVSPATETTYLIQPGDNLAQIAALFNSTVDDIMKKNKITDQNQIFAGQCITVRINLVLPSATPVASITPAASPTATP
jgi:LysM repeat protein